MLVHKNDVSGEVDSSTLAIEPDGQPNGVSPEHVAFEGTIVTVGLERLR